MKVVRNKYGRRARERQAGEQMRQAGEQMRQAVSEVIREALGDSYEMPRSGFGNRAAWLLGRTAGHVRMALSSAWIWVPVMLVLLYLIMHMSGISLEIAKGSKTIMIIR
jgi:hypothetical protein